MDKFNVTVEKTYARDYIVEADSQDEAIKIVNDIMSLDASEGYGPNEVHDYCGTIIVPTGQYESDSNNPSCRRRETEITEEDVKKADDIWGNWSSWFERRKNK